MERTMDDHADRRVIALYQSVEAALVDVRVISDKKHYPEYERTAGEVHIIGRIRWFAREI
jgi:hypothetical protein